MEKIKNIENNEFSKFLDEYKLRETNIAIIGSVDVNDIRDIRWITKEFTDKDGQLKQYKKVICQIKDEEVMIPISVLNQLKALGSDKRIGQVYTFLVNKKGEGLNTEYNVVPLTFEFQKE